MYPKSSFCYRSFLLPHSVFICSSFWSFWSLTSKMTIRTVLISISISFSMVLSAFLSDEVKLFTFKKIKDSRNTEFFISWVVSEKLLLSKFRGPSKNRVLNKCIFSLEKFQLSNKSHCNLQWNSLKCKWQLIFYGRSWKYHLLDWVY